MTSATAREKAEAILADCREMTASGPHAESEKRAALASIILDLCNQIDTLAVTAVTPLAEPEPKRRGRPRKVAEDVPDEES